MIPVNEPLLGEREEEYVLDCVRGGWISSEGPYVGRFEKAFAAYIGTRGGVGVCNGTAALEVALYGLGVGPGDEVIMPTFTIMSCAVAALRLGATPVLVDIEPETWNIDVTQVEAKITTRTKVIMAVHIYGHPVDMDPLLQIARRNGIRVLEDAAEAIGAEYRFQKCGSIGDAAAFSFYANKLVTTGEGGMVLSNDDDVVTRARSYRNLCFNRDERFLHDDIGYNFRLTSLQAAIGLAQLERVEESVARKRDIGTLYIQRLSQIPGIQTQVEKPWAKTVYWMYSLQMHPSLGIRARDAMHHLATRGVGTRPFFRGLHDQPALRSKGVVADGAFPVADQAYAYGFYLPSGLTITESQVDYVCNQVADVLKR